MQPGTGRVLALAGSQPYGVGPGQTSVNLPLGGASGFQAGSAFKVFAFSSAWFAGSTPDLAAAVWMGDPRGGYRFPLRDVELGGVTSPQVHGGGVPGQTRSALVRGALQGSPPRPFSAPPQRP